jgi:outer membrane protein assembly factor BamB
MKAAYLLTLLLVLASCKSQDSGEENTSQTKADPFQTMSWALPRGSSLMSGSIPDKVITSPRIAWSFDAAAPISGDAGVYGDRVYFGNDDGLFFALDLETGEESWRFETGDVIESEPAISSGLVFFGANDGQFYALDRLTGEERWRRQFDDKVPGGANLANSPIDGEPWVLVAGNDGMLRCLKAIDGSDVWSYQTDNLINGSPAMLDDSRIIFGGCDAFLHIVNLENGESIEQYETNAYIPCSVAVYDGIGYSGNYANEVLAFDPGDRGQIWTYSDRQFPFFSSPAVNETHVFIGSRDKRLHAIDRETGVAAWTYQTSGRVDSSPLAFSDAVVVGSTDGWLYAVSQADGTELWKMELGASLIASPVFANGRLIIGSQGGTLFSLESGETKI